MKAIFHQSIGHLRHLGTALGIIAAAILPLASGSGPHAADSNADQQNRELVLRMYHDFDAGTLDAYAATSVAPSFEAHVMGTMSMDWAGFEAFGADFLSAFPDGRHVFDYVVVQGDNIVTVGKYIGTQQGELMGIAPTGKKISLSVMHLDRVKDGKLIEHIGMANAADLMSQLGATPEE